MIEKLRKVNINCHLFSYPSIRYGWLLDYDHPVQKTGLHANPAGIHPQHITPDMEQLLFHGIARAHYFTLGCSQLQWQRQCPFVDLAVGSKWKRRQLHQV